jgi:uncharacterized protein YecT (DUF1311 family)
MAAAQRPLPGAVAAAAPRIVLPASPASPPALARPAPDPAEPAPAEVARLAPEPPPATAQAALGRPVLPHVPGALDCANVVSPAQDIVCRDPGLIAAERRMARAYAGALAAGVPEGRLRREQVDWLNMREDAALYSKQAVENIYHQRIRELEAVAGEPPP